LFVVFSWIRWKVIGAPGLVPTNDFGPNDSLIFAAKHFQLFYGNYSRVGFHHPGPFFFQIMAWFEYVFYDWLPVAGSPVGAHLMAGLAISSASMAALFVSFSDLYKNRATGLLVAFIMVAATVAAIDTREYYLGQLYFLTIWPPFLMMSATNFFVAGSAAVFASRGYGIPLLTLALMIWLHAHASFVGLVPIIIFCAIVFYAFYCWRVARTDMRQIALSWFAGHKTAFLISILIVCIFLLPILVNTLINWPGEIPKYFTFAEKREGNGLSAVILFFLGFARLSFLIVAVWLGTVISSRVTNKGWFVFFLVVSTAPAILFYAFRGLDTLQFKYPLFWIAPLIGAVVAVALVEVLDGKGVLFRSFGVIAAVLISVMWFGQTSLNGISESAEGERFTNAIAQIKQMKPTGQVVQLYPAQDAESLISSTMLVSIDVRSGERSFCIPAEVWGVYYPDAYNCDATKQVADSVIYLIPDDGRKGAIFRIGNVIGFKP
jgi:hypothetical protein